MRSRIRNQLASIHPRRIRLFRALIVGAALAGAAGWLVATAASASPSYNQPPPTTPTTGPQPPPMTTPNQPPPTTPTQPPPSTPPPSSSTNPGTTAPNCSRSHLRLKFVEMQGATGHRYVEYAFKNIGASDCSLRGYPDLVLLNHSSTAMHGTRATVRHDPVSPVKTVVIKPGKRAFFTFSWVDGGFCPGNSFAFYAIQVFAPKDLRGFVRHYGRTPACGGSPTVTRVRPKLSSF